MEFNYKFGLLAAAPIGFYLFRKWIAGGVVPARLYEKRLEGKTAIVTGANSGIGFETAQKLAELGARVVVGNRDELKSKEAISRMKNSNNIEFIKLDLTSFQSVRDFVNEFENKRHYECSILINNAGVMMCPHSITNDGFEIQFQTNHLAHFLLVNLLLKNLRRNKARIVNVSSMASHSGNINFNLWKTDGKPKSTTQLYQQSKLANVLFTYELVRRYGNDISSYSLHPGVINSELARHFTGVDIIRPIIGLAMKTNFQGAQTNLYAALVDKSEVENGSYLGDCKIKYNPNRAIRDLDLQKKLWDESEQVLKPWLS